jgi:hypothetical protein
MNTDITNNSTYYQQNKFNLKKLSAFSLKKLNALYSEETTHDQFPFFVQTNKEHVAKLMTT